jgi:hypothetical protein
LRDNQSVLKEDGKKFCHDKETYFRSAIGSILNQSSSLLVDVEVDTLESNLFDSEISAIENDEHGCPVYVAEGAWHIAYGVISVCSPRRVVTDVTGVGT